MQLTPNFQDSELGVEPGSGATDQQINNAIYICEKLLEPIRTQFGPIKVDDGYRNLAHNAAADGVATSYHLFNGTESAADIKPLAPGATMEQIFNWIRLFSHLPFDEVIYETNVDGTPGCLHLQINSAATPRRIALTGETNNRAPYIHLAVNP